MIPRLAPARPIAAAYLAFLDALPTAGWRGEIARDEARRTVAATDNSVYQILPQAILYPRTRADVVAVLTLLADPQHREVRLTPRGGGTGTNGQSLTDGLVLDLSRHLDRVLELDLETRTVRVEPGVVLDQLQDFLRPHGLFFAPELSPSNRATLGGMINTDAAGKGSRVYGKTSEHVRRLSTVLLGGEVIDSAPLDDTALEALTARPDRVGEIHRTLDHIATDKAALITEVFPKLRRFMTGYDLAHIRRDDGRFDLNAILCGSEGTLGVIVEATLALTPIPTHAALVVLGYARFDDALGAAEVLVERRPAAIETIDQMVLDLARGDAIWPQVERLLGAVDTRQLRAINLVEFTGTDPAEVEASVAALITSVEAGQGSHPPISQTIARAPADIAALWNLRKKGVGLLGNAPGARKPVPFVEDTVVPPEHLRAYIADFRALLDAEGLRYGMFGHIDVGCLHVRPALDLKDPEDEARLHRISDQVCDLVHRYGGLIWGEHGKGMRTAYSPRFFGPLWPELRRVKAAFDPHDQLNPGKIATATDDTPLVRIDAPTRGQRDRLIPPADREAYDVAIHCNGNGACFDYDPDHVMCPSAKITRDRLHSPKGRAGVMREWLARLAEADHPARPDDRPGPWLTRARNTLAREPDYSHQVYEAMHGCLSCKACATQCPIKVDVPSFKAEFLDRYHGRYLRPFRDHLVAGLESAAALAARLPRLANALAALPPARWLLARLGGIVDPPALSAPPARARLAARNAPIADPAAIAALPPAERDRVVVLVPDAFTTFFDADALLATYDLLSGLGFTPHLAPFVPNGKGLHVKGFLRRFRRAVDRAVASLRPLAALDVPLIGIDPAVVLTWRDEYPHALGLAPGELGVHVRLMQEWLADHTDAIRPHAIDATHATAPYLLMAHCTERTAAPASESQWRAVYAAAGLDLRPAAVGCCGMCGVYGHEADHAEESRGIYAMSWRKRLAGAAPERIVADGYSCRSQIKRCDAIPVRHPARALADALGFTPSASG